MTNKMREIWRTAKNNAKSRGVEWRLTLDEFAKIWLDSGHWGERGCHRGQYVMARRGDKGAYAVGNVRIVTVTQNHEEYKQSPEERERVRQHMIGNQFGLGQPGPWTGKTFSEEHCTAIGSALVGNQNGLGWKAPRKTKQRMKSAQKARRARERAEGKDVGASLRKGWETRRRKAKERELENV